MSSLRSFSFKILVAFSITISSTNTDCLSQYCVVGIDPASVKWRQINTPHFRVIYPLTFADHAQYIANGLEYNYPAECKTLNSFFTKLPVIIHNQTTIPSSETAYAPKRTDYYTTSPQDWYPQDWVDQLIIHESRHSVQYSAVNRGFTKGLSYVLGEQGTFLPVLAFVPFWFLEGDATVAETALCTTGRGRTPSFEMRIRSQFVEKGIYSYEKQYRGSYRDFVPGGFYELGYQLVGLSREIWGPDIWGSVLDNVGRHPYTLFPFSFGIKRLTGFNKYGLFDTLTLVMQKTWIERDKMIHENNYQVISKNAGDEYTNYNIPVVFRDSLIVAVKSSLDDLTKVVLISRNGNEKKLFTPGVNLNYPLESLSASDSIIYWSEMVYDPRWSFRDYRVIKTFNYNTGKLEQLTHCSRYYVPSVTKDGKFIATVEVNPDNKYFLDILDSRNGNLVKQISTPDNILFIQPVWSSDGKSIVTAVIGKGGNNIATVDPETGKVELLLQYSSLEIKRPSFWKNYIIYQASYNGIDNIYALSLDTHEVFQVTSARFGASDANVLTNQSAIIYSNYTSDGYEIVKEQLEPSTWKKTSIPEKSAFPLAEKLTQQENFIYNSDSVPKIEYASKPYRKALNLFNFHSWAPLGINFQNVSVAPGVTLLSQNLLGTTITETGYLYNRNQKTGKYYLSITDESLYPAIDLNMDYGGRQDIHIDNMNDTIPIKWKELNLSAGLRLPLKWSHNVWGRTFQPAISLNYKDLRMDESIPYNFEYNKIISVNYSLLATNLMKTSLRDLYSRWGQQLQLNFNNTPFEKGLNSIFAGQLTLDFPGISRHHGIRLYGAYQKKDDPYYSYSDYILFPRGYDHIFRDEVYSFSALYSMPLFSPDWQLIHSLYIKRFSAAAFYDFARSKDQTLPRFFSSIGLELTMDFHLFSNVLPFNAGLRSAYIPETGKKVFQFLFNCNFNAIY